MGFVVSLAHLVVVLVVVIGHEEVWPRGYRDLEDLVDLQ